MNVKRVTAPRATTVRGMSGDDEKKKAWATWVPNTTSQIVATLIATGIAGLVAWGFSHRGGSERAAAADNASQAVTTPATTRPEVTSSFYPTSTTGGDIVIDRTTTTPTTVPTTTTMTATSTTTARRDKVRALADMRTYTDALLAGDYSKANDYISRKSVEITKGEDMQRFYTVRDLLVSIVVNDCTADEAAGSGTCTITQKATIYFELGKPQCSEAETRYSMVWEDDRYKVVSGEFVRQISLTDQIC